MEAAEAARGERGEDERRLNQQVLVARAEHVRVACAKVEVLRVPCRSGGMEERRELVLFRELWLVETAYRR